MGGGMGYAWVYRHFIPLYRDIYIWVYIRVSGKTCLCEINGDGIDHQPIAIRYYQHGNGDGVNACGGRPIAHGVIWGIGDVGCIDMLWIDYQRQNIPWATIAAR